jgi:predicted nucleic acid-binding protein
MKRAFADTSFYVALANPGDSLHQAAIRLSAERRGLMVTTDFVLVELGNWLSRSDDRPVFAGLLTQLRTDPRTTIVPATRRMVEAGCELYLQRPDKDWSLTDCISFAVMEERSIRDALTADRHFEQAGFSVLLR